MGKYLHLYDEDSAFQSDYWGEFYHEPWVSLTQENEEVNYNKDKYFMMPFTIEALSAGSFYWEYWNQEGEDNQLKYSINGGNWISIPPEDRTPISVEQGDEIQFKGNITCYGVYTEEWGMDPCTNFPFIAKGNIMSLTYMDDFTGSTPVYEDNFSGLFSNYCCDYLISAKNLRLPGGTTQPGCFSWMFYACDKMVDAPYIPPVSVAAPRCYRGMFAHCRSLKEIPNTVLPATTLGEWCYGEMFGGCYSLIKAPTLPATTLAANCYFQMFSDCGSLANAPELLAPTLLISSYYGMFEGCSKITRIKCLATDLSASGCLTDWTNGVSETGTFIKHPNATWPSGSSGIPTGWTVETATE